MVAGTVTRLSSPEESRYIHCQNESKINVLYCWESKMLETISQTPPSQNLARSLQDEKNPISPNNLKHGFVLSFLSLNTKGCVARLSIQVLMAAGKEFLGGGKIWNRG